MSTDERAMADAEGDVIREVIEQRAMIEQAKGMLIFIYGIDANTAFELLRSQSQDHNIKLRVLAEQMVRDLQEVSASAPAKRRLTHDSVLMTAHRRITRIAERHRAGESPTQQLH